MKFGTPGSTPFLPRPVRIPSAARVEDVEVTIFLRRRQNNKESDDGCEWRYHERSRVALNIGKPYRKSPKPCGFTKKGLGRPGKHIVLVWS